MSDTPNSMEVVSREDCEDSPPPSNLINQEGKGDSDLPERVEEIGEVSDVKTEAVEDSSVQNVSVDAQEISEQDEASFETLVPEANNPVISTRPEFYEETPSKPSTEPALSAPSPTPAPLTDTSVNPETDPQVSDEASETVPKPHLTKSLSTNNPEIEEATSDIKVNPVVEDDDEASFETLVPEPVHSTLPEPYEASSEPMVTPLSPPPAPLLDTSVTEIDPSTVENPQTSHEPVPNPIPTESLSTNSPAVETVSSEVGATPVAKDNNDPSVEILATPVVEDDDDPPIEILEAPKSDVVPEVVAVPEVAPPPAPAPVPVPVSAAAPAPAPLVSRPPATLESVDDDEEDDDDIDETLAERLVGLTEMFPGFVRTGSSSLVKGSVSLTCSAYSLARTVSWLVFSSSVLLFMPVMIESERLQLQDQQKAQKNQILLGQGMGTSGAPSLGPPPI